MDNEKQAVFDVLRDYERLFTEIMNMIGDKPRLVGAEQEKARELLTALKAKLKEDSHDLDRRRYELNHTEKAFLEPALRKASAELKVAVNTVPDRKWHSNLYGSRINITHTLSELA